MSSNPNFSAASQNTTNAQKAANAQNAGASQNPVNAQNAANAQNVAASHASAKKLLRSGAGSRKGGSSQIERDMQSIFLSLHARVGEGTKVFTSHEGHGHSAKWTASVYRMEDLERQKMEEITFRASVTLGAERGTVTKPFRARPVAMYAFYPHTLNPERLGSVAIYADDAFLQKAVIDRTGTLFGFKVTDTAIKMGRRQFVDVRLAL